MKVALLDVKMDGANAVADEIGGTAVACDVTSSDSAEAAIAAAREAHGVASLLVNCAGIATPGRIVGRNGPLPLETYASVIQVNLIGSFNMIRLFGADLYGTDPMTDGQRGLIDTPMMAGLPEEARESLAQQPEFPKRLGHPDEYARLVMHMCENVLINDAVLRLDGALRMAAR